MNNPWNTFKKWWSKIISAVIIIGALLAIWAAYDQFFKKPNILSQIINEINVLDVHKSLKDLQIIFQGDNIQEKNLNLRIYRIEIENNGGTNIIQNDFDQNDSWGIKVEKGRIIEARLVDSNSEYINKNLSPQIQDSDIVKFNKIIFDKGDFFTIELLVLHDKDTPPVLYRIGKIAGIQDSESKISAIKYDEPFWTTFFYGSWLVNFVRFIFFFIIFLVFLTILGVSINKWREKRTRAQQSPQPPQQPN